jgi:enediyne biosynthesis protein E4
VLSAHEDRASQSGVGRSSTAPEQSPTPGRSIELGAKVPFESLGAHEDSSQRAPQSRLLLAVVVVQVLAQVTPITERVQARIFDTTTAESPLVALDNSAWIHVVAAAGLLLLIVLAVVALLRRPRTGGPVGWMALGAAAAAQAFLLLGTIVDVAQNAQSGLDAAAGSLRPSPDLVWLSAAIGLLVFLLTFTAYLTLRSRAPTAAIGREIPTAGRNGSRVGRVALGVAATLIVLTGSLASASTSGSPVACADVTRDVGITFRGALGDSVVDGSDGSVLMQQNMGNGVAVGDYNADGNLDLYLLGQPGHENRLYRNDHTSSHEGFTDVTDAAGLGGLSGSRAAQFVDLNNDGRLDLVVVNDYARAGLAPGTALQPSRIYENLGGGSFQDVTGGSGFNPVGLIVGGLGIADYNRDGLPDIYITYWTGGMGISENYGAHNLLFENLGNFRFKDVTEQVGLGSLSTGSFTPIFADLNGDGWPDLYVAVDGAPEMLFINDHGTFRDATNGSGLGAVRNGMGAALLDPEGAGVPSIYVTNITEPEHKLGTPPGGDALLRARLRPGGATAYVDDATAAGVRDAGWAWGAAFTDLNLDGYPDLFVAQGMHASTRGVSAALTNDRAHVFVGTGIGTFVESRNNGCDIPGDQRAVVAFDYNRDGAPDLLVTQVGYDFKLLENRSEPVGHWLTVVLEPTAGRTVVGAKVTVTAGGHRWLQTLFGGGGYLSGPPYEAYFGLGSVDRITSVAVDWPDGTTTARSDVRADRLLLMSPP